MLLDNSMFPNLLSTLYEIYYPADIKVSLFILTKCLLYILKHQLSREFTYINYCISQQSV